MPPLTKFWLTTLKDLSQQPDTLTPLLTEILELCSSFTGALPLPATRRSQTTHAFFSVTNAPGHLMMITGFPSQELNNEVHEAYEAQFLSRFFAHAQHVWMRQIEVDIRELPIQGNKVVVNVSLGSKGDSAETEEEGKGGWDVLTKTRQEAEEGDVVQGEVEGERAWVSVKGWEGEGQRDINEEGRSVFHLQKIVGM
ncbi:hypothetical protein BJX63DRAFT_431868 [Aspergillus granulosus]|uniref:Uncharacterized protein n=1 Tax=Aspergillus granulosus TaxID=176169 RepID=A0ABR4HDL8_9EURO